MPTAIRADPAPPKLAAEREPVAAGEHHVEYDDVERAEHGAFASVIVGRRLRDLKSFLAQPVLDDRRELGIVFD